MQWQRAIGLGGLVLALAALAAWQWDEYGHECALARHTVSGSAQSVMNALVGGVQSHRRLGPFFSQQIQGVLDGLVQSEDLLAVALVSEDGKPLLSAGEAHRLVLAPPFQSGEYWETAGLRLVRRFQLPSETGGPGGGPGRGRRWRMELEESSSPFTPGATVAAMLLVDRQGADLACSHAAVLRGSVVGAGWLVVLCVAMVWRATVRLAEARGKQRTLEIEARHLRDLSQAAAGLAHETRNPLGLIRGWTQRLAESLTASSEDRRQARAVVEECDRVTARINQFLAFARPSEPEMEPFDPAEVVAELAVILEPDLAARQVTLRPMATGTTVRADREMFRQALFNLLQNAVQASPEHATVEVSAARGRRGTVKLEVADRGAGVPNAVVDKLFIPYFTTRPGGTGLGLAIVRRIAAAHGWDAGYTPRAGGGALFWLDGIHG